MAKKVKKSKKCNYCDKIKKLIYMCPECGDEYCKKCAKDNDNICTSYSHEPPELEKI